MKPNLLNRLNAKLKKKFYSQKGGVKASVKDLIIDYREFVDFDVKHVNSGVYPGVSPMWDNSARRVGQNAIMFKNSTPVDFKYWYQQKIKPSNFEGLEDSFVFINAWNEWAEGNHLEPCEKWEKSYLEALL